MFPEPREQAKAIGVYGFVASAGGTIGLLAGGVLTQAINWHWIFFINIPIGMATAVLAMRLIERDKGIGLGEGADVLGAVLITGVADARRLHDRQAGRRHGWSLRRTLAFGAVSLALLVAFIVREATARDAADPAADLPLAQRLGRERRSSRCSWPGCSGCSSWARSTCERVLGYDPLADRLRVPAGDDRDGHAVAALLRAADHALRRADDAAPGPGADRVGLAPVHARAGRRQLRRARPAGDAPARRRHRRLVPRADDARDVGRHPGGRRARLRPRQHDRAGRRRARARRARHALDHPHRATCSTTATRRRGAHRRLPPRVLDRRRAGARRARRRADGAAAGGQGRRGGRGEAAARAARSAPSPPARAPDYSSLGTLAARSSIWASTAAARVSSVSICSRSTHAACGRSRRACRGRGPRR